MPFVHWLCQTGNYNLVKEYEDYVRDVKKELREWWFKRKQDKYILNDQGDVLMNKGIPVTREDIELGNIVNNIIAKSIDRPINKELIS